MVFQDNIDCVIFLHSEKMTHHTMRQVAVSNATIIMRHPIPTPTTSYNSDMIHFKMYSRDSPVKVKFNLKLRIDSTRRNT